MHKATQAAIFCLVGYYYQINDFFQHLIWNVSRYSLGRKEGKNQLLDWQLMCDLRHFGAGRRSESTQGTDQNRRRPKSAQVKIDAEKNELTVLYSALTKKNFVCEFNSFAFNGNSLHWEHDCIFALPLRLSVNHYYKQVISAQS